MKHWSGMTQAEEKSDKTFDESVPKSNEMHTKPNQILNSITQTTHTIKNSNGYPCMVSQSQSLIIFLHHIDLITLFFNPISNI